MSKSIVVGLTGPTGSGKSLVCDFLCENTDGTLNRKKLAQIAFSSSENTKALNEITHPFIIERVKSRISEYKNSGHTRIVYDAPLLFESGTDALCDKVVAVVADLDVRKKRIMRRDNLTELEVEKRVNAQHDDSFYTEKADFVILNNSNTIDLSEKVAAVLFALTR